MLRLFSSFKQNFYDLQVSNEHGHDDERGSSTMHVDNDKEGGGVGVENEGRVKDKTQEWSRSSSATPSSPTMSSSPPSSNDTGFTGPSVNGAMHGPEAHGQGPSGPGASGEQGQRGPSWKKRAFCELYR